MFRSWFTRWQRNSSKARSEQRARRTRQRGYKPVLEAVEERVVPCTINWRDPVSGFWDDPTKWDRGQLPTPADHVCILRPGTGDYTVTVRQGTQSIRRLEATKTIIVSGGELRLNVPQAISVIDGNGLIVRGGILTVAGNLHVLGEMVLETGFVRTTTTGEITADNTLSWSGGVLGGPGKTTAIRHLAITGDALKVLDGHTLETYASFGVWQGTGAIQFQNNARLKTVRGTRLFVRTNAPITGIGTIENDGFFHKLTSTGETVIAPAFHNTNQVHVQTGILTLLGNGNHTGDFTRFLIDPGAFLRFLGGTHTLNAGAFISPQANSGVLIRTNVTIGSQAALTALPGSIVQIDGGSATFDGVFTSSGRLDVFNSPRIAFNRNASIQQIRQFGGTITVASGMTLTAGSGGYELATGVLTGPGALIASGQLTWTGGTMQGPGTTRANGGLVIEGLAIKPIIGRTIVNAGNAVWRGGLLQVTTGSRIENLQTGRFEVTAGVNLDLSGAGPLPTFLNQGTFLKPTGSGQTVLQATFDNRATGRVVIDGSRLAVVGPFMNTGFVHAMGTVAPFEGLIALRDGTSDGTYQASTRGTLQFSVSGHTFNRSTINLDGGTLNVSRGMHVFSANSNVAGGGTVDFDAGAGPEDTTTIAGGYAVRTTLMRGGTVNFNSPASTTNLTLSGGTLGGTGTLTVTGSLTWTGGTMSGTGTTSIAAGGTLALSGPAVSPPRILARRTLSNAGMATWSEGGSIQFVNDAVFSNQAGATFDAVGTALMFGSGTFSNAGTFRKSNGGTTAIDVPFQQAATGRTVALISTLLLRGGGAGSGRFDLTSATLLFDRLSYTINGTAAQPAVVTVAADSSLAFMRGTHTLGVNSRVNSAGSVVFGAPADGPGGQTAVAGIYDSVGYTYVSGASVEFRGNAITRSLSLRGTDGAGVLSIASGHVLRVDEHVEWSGGGIVTGGGELDARGNIALEQGGHDGNKWLQGGTTLNSRGTTTWTGGPLRFRDRATWMNDPAATFEARTDQTMVLDGAAGPAFVNRGVFRKLMSAGITHIEVALNNTGSVEVLTGELRLSTGRTETGTVSVSSGATLNFAGSTPYTLVSRDITGEGNIRITGSLAWTGGTMRGTALTTVTATGTLDIRGPADKTLDGRPLVVSTGGTVNWLGGRILTESSSTITNNGTFHVQSDATLRTTTGAGSSFTNAGTFRKSAGDGTTTILIPFLNTNTGTVDVQRGTLDLANDGTNNGSLIISNAAATLQLSSRYTLQGIVSGVGNLLIAAAVDWTGGTMRGPGTTTVASSPIGTLNIRGIATKTLDGRRLVNNGRVNWLDRGTLDALGNARIENTAAFVIQNAAQLGRSGAPAVTFINTGTVSKSSAEITQVLSNVAFLSSNALILNSGTLNLEGTGTLSGSITGAGHLDISGVVDWASGTMTGPGRTIVSGQGTLNLTSDVAKRLDRRPLENRKTVNWLGGNLLLREGVVISNIGGAAFNVEHTGRFGFVFDGVSNSRFENSGTFRKRGGTDITTIGSNVNFSGTGAIEVLTGTLDLVERLPNMQLNGELVGGTYLVRGTLKFTGADIQTNRANIALEGAGSRILNQNDGNALASFTRNAGGATFTIKGDRDYRTTGIFTNEGTIELRDTGTLTMGNVVRTVSGGFFDWYGGIIGGTGDLQIDGGGKLNVLGVDPKELRGRRILVAGTVDTSSVGGILLGKGSQLQIQQGGRLDIRSFLFTLIGFGTLSNSGGTIEVHEGSNATLEEGIVLTLTPNGQLIVNGTLRLRGGLSNYTYDDIDGDLLADGNYVLRGVLEVPRANLVRNRANLTLAGPGMLTDENGTPALTNLSQNLPGATFQLVSGALLGLTGGFINQGRVTLGVSSLLVTASTFVQTSPTASLNLAGGELYSEFGVELHDGTLSGSGIIYGDVLNRAANVRVGGDGTGRLEIYGNYLQESGGALELQLKNTAEYDEFVVSGFAQLDGTLRVRKMEGFSAQPGDEFRILTTGMGLQLEDSLFRDLDDPQEFDPIYDGYNLTLVYLGS